ncbi:MAG: T9SS type A sorting domain-containing protein [Bacteroidetes bacterium]|nr:T9SS type A sorting domain-containing protein [Bacteroidota bacterium]
MVEIIHCKGKEKCLLFLFFFIVLLKLTDAQKAAYLPSKSRLVANTRAEIVQYLMDSERKFLVNEGQYGDTLENYVGMGKILYGYEGLDMPILFTAKGIMHLQRTIQAPSEHEKEKLESMGIKEEVIAQQVKVSDRVITMEWLNCNPDVKIVAEDTARDYHTYGFLTKKVVAFKRITYFNLYPGIDLVYTFDKNTKVGFKYSLLIQPNADLSKVQLKFSGDLKKIFIDSKGNLILKSDINGISESAPISYYSDALNDLGLTEAVKIVYVLDHKNVSFQLPPNYDHKRPLTLDPFISTTTNLTGTNANKAKDIDFDYAGNVFVTGGGDNSIYKLAKYDSSGALQWTFSGALTVPSWTFGTYYGGWVVDKSTGNTYLGQGFAPGGGFRIIRLNPSGTYDNYITSGNPNFMENWKMLWSCNNGSPQIIVAGGGTNSNLNFGICSPPSTTITGVNITGIPYAGATGWAQDIADVVLDPINYDMYTIYGSLFGTPSLSNKIYKNPAPYSATTVSWNVASGYTSISEAFNRPYLTPNTTLMDNSCNSFAINSSYLFYWDGKNLKAFNKATGASAGTPLTIASNSILMQGGIVADECNNIYIGSINGTIKVYSFNGSTFNDSPVDITVSGFTTKSIYDLVLSDAKKILYACGDGFVASINVSSYGCASNVYTLNISSGCVNQTATAVLNPTPPSNTNTSYFLYNGTTQITSNNTGIFTGLSPNVSYTIHAFVNQACSGTEAVKSFTILGPALSITQTYPTCGNSNGSITAAATGGTGTLRYSIDGVTFQNSGNFTALASGIYDVMVEDSVGCSSTISFSLSNSNGPTFTTVNTDAFCGTSNGTINITGANGTSPYTYSINNGSYSSNNIFDSLASGSYLITIKDFTGCTTMSNIVLNSQGNAIISKVRLNATCGNNNGSITLNASAGVPPYQYSINGSSYQTGSSFTGLSAGYYTLNVKDSNNCISSINDTIVNTSGPTLSSSVVSTSCTGSSGSITLHTSGGTSPFQYSNNGGASYQSSNVFNGLFAGSYLIKVQDANGCVSNSVAMVYRTVPQVTDTTTNASCTLNDGSITAVGTGGTPPYQFSINGASFQSSPFFLGLGAGSYTLTIRDTTGCSSSISPVYVNNSAGLRIIATSIATSCASTHGEIILSGSGGLAPLKYSINSINYQSSGTFSSLAAGNYMATVKDSNGCIATIHVAVGVVAGPNVTTTVIAASCNNPTGSLVANATSGTPPYMFSINGITFQSSNLFLNLSSGTYTVTVKDSNLCLNTTSVTIINVGTSTGPTISATSIAAECNQANGRIDANSSGGKNPKKHSIDGINYQGSGTFNNVPPGTYTVYVLDDNGCTNTCTVTVGNIAGPQVTAVDSASVCGSSTGKITLTGINGTPPYKFSLNGGGYQISNQFSGLSAGYYTITVRDAANICNNSIIVKVNNSNGPSLSLSKIDVSCASQNGKITAIGTGGAGILNYSIDGLNYQSSNVFSGLPVGQYAVYVKDSIGCTNTNTITVTDIVVPQVSATQSSEKCGNVNGTITAIGSFGTTPYEYSINDTNFQTSNTFVGLAAGNYTLTLKDSNGCIAKTNLTIIDIDGPALSTTTYNPSCGHSNGTLIITGRGGNMPYQFSIDGVNFQSSFMFANLPQGTYFITLKDSNNCTAFDTVTLVNTAAFTVSVAQDTSGCAAGRASLVATVIGGTGPFQYSIDSVTFQSSNVFHCVLAGFYHVVVRDTNLCYNSTNITIIGAVLEVSLLYFNAIENKELVDLNWVTTSELNSDYFTIERSRDGLSWESIGNQKAAGRSTNIIHYKMTDRHPYSQTSYYRLKETNLDLHSSYSKICTVHYGDATQINIYPSPASDRVNIVFQKITKTEIEVTSSIGQQIIIPYSIESNRIILNTTSLENGIYYLHLKSEGREHTLKFIIIKQ